MFISTFFTNTAHKGTIALHFASWVSRHASIQIPPQRTLRSMVVPQWFTLSLREAEPMLKYDWGIDMKHFFLV